MGSKNLELIHAPSGASLNLTKRPMKKALQITGKILYFIIAMSPIFALGYMLGMKL
jgi:hypothetical protein